MWPLAPKLLIKMTVPETVCVTENTVDKLTTAVSITLLKKTSRTRFIVSSCNVISQCMSQLLITLKSNLQKLCSRSPLNVPATNSLYKYCTLVFHTVSHPGSLDVQLTGITADKINVKL